MLEQSLGPESTTSAHGVPAGAFPLSAAQRGIWFAQHVAGDAPISIAQYVEIDGDLDVELLKESSRTAGREFGTGFLRLIDVDDQPMQVVDKTLDDAIEFVDLRDAADPVAAAHAWMRAEYSAPLHMRNDRLVAVAVLRLADHRYFWYSRIHHIVLDGFGAMTMLKRAADLYNAAVHGTAPGPATADDLTKIVDADSAYRSSDRFGADREYWREHLAGMADSVSLAGRTADVDAHPRVVTGELPSETAALLDWVAKAQSSSVAPIVVAAFGAYLGRMTGAPEVMLSLPVSARTTAVMRRSGGMIANVVPLRLTLGIDTTIGDLIATAQSELTGALRRQRYRQEDIFRDLGWAMDEAASFGPSVNLMMMDTRVELGPITGRLHVLTSGLIEDLFLNLYPGVGGDSTHIDFQANPNLYTEAELTGHYHRFLRFLHRFLAVGTETTQATLEILTESELERLRPVRGPASEAARTFTEILAAGVAVDPSAIAVRCGATAVTYRELDERSNRIARVLIAQGIGPEQTVAIAIPRSLESVSAMWAVAKTGAAFVPVDPKYPADRIQHMIRDSGAGAGIALRSEGLPGAISWLQLDDPRIENQSPDAIVDSERTAPQYLDQTAYIIYTSGSTGLPKGVLVSHRGLANLVAAARETLGVTAESTVAHAVSPSFDASIEELLVTFATGATLAVVPPSAFGGEEMAAVLSAHRVTHLDVTPAVVASMDPTHVPELRTIVVGGDVCPPDLIAKWSDRTLINSYGPTEATVTATFTGPMSPTGPVSIGTVVRGASAVVLDAWLRPVPIGGTGELYLAGPGLARGYHNRVGQTSDRFVANPFGAPGDRMYRTGDLVRWNDDAGSLWLEYLGRSDFQVKVRGYRIELGEIDAALQRHAEVDFALTIGAKTPAGATALVSYIHGEAGVAPEQVKAFIAEFLPAYMVPTSIMVLDSIPLTPVGKVDRKALPDPEFGTRTIAGRAPSTPQEKLLAGLFAEVLGLESVGVDESFFALGGDSIVSIQLVSRAKAAGLAFSARDVFERKTIAGLAAVAASTDTVDELLELPGGGVGAVPLTPIVADMVMRGSHNDRFAQAVLVAVPADLSREHLVAAAQAVIDHHDMLRARLTADGIVVPAAGSVDAEQLVDHVRADGDAAIEAELQRAADRLDPAAGILARWVWIERDGADGALWIVLHHLAVDGVSWRILLPDFVTAWSQAVSNAPTALAPVATSFRRWAHGQVEQAQSAARVAELPTWERILQTVDQPLGARAIDPTVDVVATMARIETTVPEEIAGTLLATVPDRFHCGADDGLLTGLAMAVASWRRRRGVDQPATLITLEGHGREAAVVPLADIGRTVGWFTSVYPMALDLAAIDLDDAFAGGPGAGAAIKAVKEQLRAVPDRGVGYGMLRHLNGDTGPTLAAAGAPQISFNYLGRTGTGGAEGLWLPQRFASTQDDRTALPAVIDINGIAEDTADGVRLAMTWAYASELLAESDVVELAELWGSALRALAEHARSDGAGGRTPSDFELAPTTQVQIDLWERRYPTMLDVWPLSPLQFGLLFHALYDTDTADGYTVQAILTLAGTVDATRLRTAAQGLVDRHENLRVGFVETDDGPRQIVVRDAEIGWQEIDLTGGADRSEQDELDRVIAADAATRFDLTQPPLLRFTLIRTGVDAYRLVMTNHHIVLDGWSTPLLVRELLLLYITAGDATSLPPARSYRDFLAWLGRQDTAASKAAWATSLAGIDSATRVVESLAKIQSTRTGQISVELSAATLASLRNLSRRTGATVNTAVQAAWALLLATMTGRTDVVFGGTVSGRPPQLPGVEDMLGLFINTLPVRVSLNPGESVAELLTRIQTEQAALLDHQHVGLADIHQAVGVAELFDTLTVFESYPVDREALAQTLDIAGMRIVDFEGTDATPYPLNLMVIPDGDAIAVNLKYLADELDDAAARTLLDRFVRLLDRVADDPTVRVASLQSCDDAERAVLAPVSGPAAVEVSTLGGLLSASAAVAGDAIAVSATDTVLTYRELDDWSNRLARVLLRHGAGPEKFVALALSRSVESVVAVWAVSKTGAAFVPMDPNHPPERIEHMASDSRTQIGVTTTSLGTNLPATIDWLLLDDLNTIRKTMTVSAAPITDDDRGAPIHIDQIAYLIYTSGSTGKPKAVLLSHRGMANLVAAQRESLGVDADSRVLLVASPSFDASVFELLMAHGSGGRVVVAPPEVFAGPALHDLLVAEEVSHAVITPSAVSTMEPAGLQALRVLAVAGEAASAELVERWSVGRKLVNLYGPTEFSIWATGTGQLAADRLVTIGGPIRGASTMVLDTWLRPVPMGISGELYLAGPGVSRGYYNRTAMNAARFIADPFGRPGERMYRTGDMVRWVVGESGTPELEYLGRSDFQVKIRGLRIELGEIDTVLSQDESVEYAATIGRDGPAGATVLVAYVLPTPGVTLDTERLREQVAAVLPGYMVPAYIVVLDEIPLTPVGKLDRKALPTPDFSDSGHAYLAPRTETEHIIAAIFGEIVGRDHVSIDQSFFDLGGNSLLATRVISRINAAFSSADVESTVALRDLFDAPTTAQLAARVSRSDITAIRPALIAGTRPARVPLSSAQKRMWVLNQLDTGSDAYNIAVALRLTGELDVSALRAAVGDVVARHETLRTIFPADAEGPQQVIVDAASASVAVTEGAAAGDELYRSILQLTTAGFDLARETPLRVGVFEVSHAEHVVVMVVHHISADGFSMGPLTRDVMIAYAARIAGTDPGWSPLAVQYADFALWQDDLLGTDDDPDSLLSRQIAYWRAALAGMPEEIGLPVDRPRGLVPANHGRTTKFAIDGALAAGLTDLARSRNASLFMAVHTTLAVVLARLSGAGDIALGTPVAGRGEAALDDIVGMFVNTLVLRTGIDPDEQFVDLLDRVRRNDLDAFEHADVPFERLLEMIDPVRSPARHPLFQVMFAFQNLGLGAVELPGLTVEPLDPGSDTAKFDLEIIVTPGAAAQGMSVDITYATDLFDDATVSALIQRWLRIMHAVVADPAVAVGAIELLDPAERADLTSRSGSAGEPVELLGDLLTAAAVANPDGTAIVSAGKSVTYAQLNADAEHVARLLIQRGVGPEDIVAVGIRRSMESVLAVWAVAKTGAAFLPIDPNYPADRIEHMLADSGTRIGLTVASARQDLPDTVDWIVLDDNAIKGAPAAPSTAQDRLRPVRPAHPAYVIYTSGSTGKPKGVVVTHAGIANLAAEQRERFEVTSGSRTLAFASPSFDASVLELLLAACASATMVIAPTTVYGGTDLAELLRREKVTHAFVTPAALATVEPAGLDDLEMVLVGGEACSAELVTKWAGTDPAGRRRFFNGYGPTEATVATNICGPIAAHDRVTIGGPIRGTRSAVLDSRLRPVPVGVAGELYLSGDALARGYRHRPGLSADRFVADPYGPTGARMYRTGDVVRWTRDGDIEYLGRSDFQVKIRGFRIELGEIDAVLSAYDGVDFAATIGSDARPGGTALVSYVVGAPGRTLDHAELIAFAGSRLPSYMVPASIMVLDAVPLTPVGKLDRAALPAPVFAAKEFRAPTNLVETGVAAVFATAFGLDRVGLDDDFFELGGNSLIATRVVNDLRRTLGRDIEMMWIFADSTVVAFAARIEAAPVASTTDRVADPLAVLLPIRAVGDLPPLFCIHPASGLAWSYGGLAQLLEPGRPIYGVQSPELGSDEPAPRTIESFADRYADEIRSVQPHGPYHLLGWSLGGFIAHAVAARLQASGERVDLLAVLDADLASRDLEPAQPLTPGEFVGEFGSIFGVDDVPQQLTAEGAAALIRERLGVDSIGAEHVVRLTSSYNNSLRILEGYRPPVFEGDLLLFTAIDGKDDPASVAAGWTPFVNGRVENVDVDAAHDDMTAPAVLPTIARVLDMRLGAPTPSTALPAH
ncbi:amino acid adenylation domain-containing protein [Antrihabitans cavernicola]|uniref:Amino acid adenylation domain-containing protein n=1 Tax=Antrihabitans cavernicola TaxID=2495913 RepID=A0A5A7SEV5_9NOCA|nr:non-ribosomal peptide synthetase [Spelaeibacter cavernicola]KAA0023247.1 amino acid adenylation domain-containing protein [Spelaeibacter cavernicola]